MSTHRILLSVIFVLLLVAGVAVMILTNSQKLEAKSSGSDQPAMAGSELIKGYKDWTKVNPEPAVFHSQIASLCARPTTQQIAMDQGDPHRDKFITVYVNDIGRHAMMEEKTPHFPQGSIIVKEKLTTRESSAPELLTVMVKREPGYNSENGDWEYMALDGSGKSVQARGKLENCQACHLTVKDRDYVSRNYLPYELYKKLK